MPDINITLDNSDKVVNVTLEQEEPVVNVEVVSSGPAGAPGYTPVKGVDYFDGQDGADGVSPEVSIGTITGGHSVTITDVDHPGGQTFNIMDGTDGNDGNDGVSPTVSITTITGGHQVDVTDAGGTTSFNVMDGADGAPGVGVPTGGTTGQVLKKASGTDYDTEWADENDIPLPYTANPAALGTASPGSSDKFARGDHVHKKPTASDLGITVPSASDTNPQNLGSKSAGVSTRWARGDHVHEMPYWMGRATCSTAEATTAKTASINNYALKTGSIVSIRFENAVPASATLNISSTGAHAIYYKNSAILAGIIKAGDTATFIYSTYYHLISIDRQPSKSDVGLGNVDNVQQYSANNPPPYPVTSVNNQTGAVSLSIPSTASDVGAVAVAQGVAHAGEFVVVGSDGNITTVTMATWQGGSY